VVLKYGGKTYALIFLWILLRGAVIMYIILVYDICMEDNGQKVLGKVFKTCKKYLTHVQDSVFEGEVSDSQLIKLKLEINSQLRNSKDSVIVFKTRQEKWLNKEFLGIQIDKTSSFI